MKISEIEYVCSIFVAVRFPKMYVPQKGWLTNLQQMRLASGLCLSEGVSFVNGGL